MKPRIFDITPLISGRLGVFPGDQPFTRKTAMSFKTGDHLELSSILTTVHLGAHADAPSHYHPDGVSIEKRPLSLYLGRAQVIRIRGLKAKERVQARHLPAIRAPRVLIDTQSFPNPEVWNSDFNSLSPEALDYLADQGVRLVGIDTPSVDPEDSKKLEAHQRLFARNFAVLEGLVLKEVPEGEYTLIALPLPIENGDASPVRAILVSHVQLPEFE